MIEDRIDTELSKEPKEKLQDDKIWGEIIPYAKLLVQGHEYFLVNPLQKGAAKIVADMYYFDVIPTMPMDADGDTFLFSYIRLIKVHGDFVIQHLHFDRPIKYWKGTQRYGEFNDDRNG